MFKYLEQVDSTNSYCESHFKDLADKSVVYTYNQTNGRGRFNRKWIKLGTDNVYMSIVLKPSILYQKVYSNLTQYTSLVLAELLSSNYDVKPVIKWPNDVLVNGRKIAGILAEAVYNSGKLEGIIIGIGVNLNTKKELLSEINQPATALNIESGKEIDKNNFLKNFYEKFFINYDKFLNFGFKSIKTQYEQYCSFLNKTIKIHISSDSEISGKAEKISDDGALIIDGTKYYTGDVEI